MKQGRASLTAEKYLRQAATLKPLDPRVHGFLGFARLRAGCFYGALVSFDVTLALENQYRTTTTLCGRALSLAGLGYMMDSRRVLEEVKSINQHESCLSIQPAITFIAERQPTPMLRLDGGRSDLSYAELCNVLESYSGGLSGWRQFLESSVLRTYVHSKGRRRTVLVFLGKLGPEGHLKQIVRSLRIIREVHNCNWPAEFWTEAGEAHLVTDEDLNNLADLGAEFHVVPTASGSWPLEHVLWKWLTDFPLEFKQHSTAASRLTAYSLKPIVLLLSGCDECLFLDADNLLLQPPEQLLNVVRTHGALFWPDIWDSPKDSHLWTAAFSEKTREMKSQESGQLFLSKASHSSREALLLATLFAVRADVFLNDFYSLGNNELMCGYGDKDIYHIAFRLLSAPFKMVAPLPKIVLSLGEGGQRTYAGTLQVDDSSKPLFLHGNQIKDALLELMVRGKLEGCSFQTADAAKNLTCASTMGRGSSQIPLHSLICSPLQFPALEKILSLVSAHTAF